MAPVGPVGDWAPGSHRKKAERGKLYFTNLQSKENVPTMINPKPCGHLCCCVVRGCEQVQCDPGLPELQLGMGKR